MSVINYKSRNLQLQHRLMIAAKTIAEQYPRIAYVDVEVVMHFHTSVCPTETVVQKHKYTLTPDSKIHIYFLCPNGDCTGHGFDLTSKLEECLREEHIIEGILNCDGKEDGKYIHAAGCSCLATCEYKLSPFLK